MKLLEYMDEEELRDLMNTLCKRVVDGAIIMGVEKPQFVLVLFNDPKVAQYAANCTRETMIEAMRETADRLESKQDVSRIPFP